MSASTEGSESRTAAALAARRRGSQAALDRVADAITRLHKEKAPVSVAAVARRAAVSRTFLYTNPDAKALIAQAVTQEPQRDKGFAGRSDDPREASWPPEHIATAASPLQSNNPRHAESL